MANTKSKSEKAKPAESKKETSKHDASKSGKGGATAVSEKGGTASV